MSVRRGNHAIAAIRAALDGDRGLVDELLFRIAIGLVASAAVLGVAHGPLGW